MKTNVYNIILAICSMLIMASISGCSKTPGCMDEDADNFYFFAEEDDGTCYYSGGVVFYHDLETSQNLVNAGIKYIKFYVDGHFEKSVSANIYWSYIPDCQNDEAFTIENYGLGQTKSKFFDYAVKDQDENVLKTGKFTIRANACEVVKFIF
ncbi:hypothetical protein ACFLRI_01755 [Bacteroidota bacterium]